MTRTYHKIGDTVYYEDSDNPGVYRKISGSDFSNAPSNAVQVGPNLYNTPENIELMKQAETYFAKQEKEQKKKEQVEASKPFAQKQAEAQAQVTSVPHVTSPEYHTYLESQEKQEKKKIAEEVTLKRQEKENEIPQNIASTFAPPFVSEAMKIINKIKKETVGIPATREARIDEAMRQLYQRQTQPPKIAKPISPDEVPEKEIKVAFAGGIAPILARVGTALWDFILKNPKTIGATMSTTAIANAISQTAQTEEKKNQILWEIGQQNPQLVSEIGKEITQAKTNPIASIADTTKYAVIGIAGLILLIYLVKKTNLIIT